MDLKQAKILKLTMELDLKVREYNELCRNLEQLKDKNDDLSNSRLLVLKELFNKNNEEINRINKELKEQEERRNSTKKHIV